MAASILEPYKRFFRYRDGRVLANPLHSPSHQFSTMVYVLQSELQGKDDMARAYIRSSIGYLFVFPIDEVAAMFFKHVTDHPEMCLNLERKSWQDILIARNQPFPHNMANRIHANLQALAANPSLSASVSDRVSGTNQYFKRMVLKYINCRKLLAFVLSILPSNLCDKIGRKNWLAVLEDIADDEVNRHNSFLFAHAHSRLCADLARRVPQALRARDLPRRVRPAVHRGAPAADGVEGRRD